MFSKAEHTEKERICSDSACSFAVCTMIYLYDGDNSIEELDNAGGVLAKYARTTDVDEPLSQLRSGAVDYYEQDGVGSTSSLSNSAGTVASSYTYDSFGRVIASSGTLTNRFQYAGREFDPETGLLFNRARYLDPIEGRFLSEDPIRFDSDDDDFYAYVGNDPMDYADPFGYARKPGKTPNKRWPKPPQSVCGRKPKWNPEGYWEGNGRRLTWDDRSHGTGVDRGKGPQGGHWDDETSDNRWDQNGNPLPGSQTSQSSSTEPSQQSGPSLPTGPSPTTVGAMGTATVILYVILSALFGQWN